MQVVHLVKSFVMSAVIAASTISPSVNAAEYELKVADAFPSNHYIAVQGAKFWMSRVEELTQGKVAFNYFTSGQLGSLSDMLDLAQHQVADITYVPISSFADRLPLSGVTELPGLFVDAEHGSRAFMLLLNEYLIEAEFINQDVMPLWGAMLPQYQVASAQGPIRTMEDFQGVRLRTPGGILEIAADEMGALAVPMGGPEMYPAFQRGTVDATVNAFASLNSYKLNEVINAASTNTGFGSFAFTYIINLSVFEGLPADIQDAFLKAGEETSVHIAQWMDENEVKIANKFAEEGIEIYEVSDESLEQWAEALSNVADRWAERLDTRGAEALERWKKALQTSR